MSVTVCDKYRIVFHAKHLLQVARDLAIWGNFELTPPLLPLQSSELDSESQTVAHRLAIYEQVVASLTEYSAALASTRVDIDFTALNNLAIKVNDLQEIIDRVITLDAETVDLRSRERKLIDIKLEIADLKELEQNIFAQSDLVFFSVLRLSAADLQDLQSLINQDMPMELVEIGRSEEETIMLLAGRVEQQEQILGLLARFNPHQVTVPTEYREKSPKEIWQQLEAEQQKLTDALTNYKAELETIAAEHGADILATLDLLKVEEKALTIARDFVTNRIDKPNDLVIEGWVAPAMRSQLAARLQGIEPQVELEDILESSDQRTILTNSTLLKPFEIVTGLMGTPSAEEIDPSPFLAPFFVLFFGFALGDAGYGIVITLVCIYLLFIKQVQDDMRNAVKLMLYCALSTVFFGAITGGWFGANLDTIPGEVGALLRSWKAFDLQSSIIFVLAGSLAIGFVQQLFGLILQFATLVMNRKYLEALAVPGTWFLLLVTIVLLVMGGSVPELAFVTANANIILPVVLILFAFGQGRNQKNWLLKPLIGLMSLFNITGYLSNTLSYARLLALGLATGVIASVINLLANMFGNTDSILGLVILSIVLVLGHAFNIALNILGTFVNVVRLQLVEFFPRFFEAKGEKFEPTTVDTRFINIASTVSGGSPEFDLIYYSK